VKRVEVFEKGDQQAVVGVDEHDNVTVTYYEFTRLVELDGWRFSHELQTEGEQDND
jgi:hypothetical protein